MDIVTNRYPTRTAPSLHCFMSSPGSESCDRIQHRTGGAGHCNRRGRHEKLPAIPLRCLATDGLEIEVVENGHAHGHEDEGVNRLRDSLYARRVDILGAIAAEDRNITFFEPFGAGDVKARDRPVVDGPFRFST